MVSVAHRRFTKKTGSVVIATQFVAFLDPGKLAGLEQLTALGIELGLKFLVGIIEVFVRLYVHLIQAIKSIEIVLGLVAIIRVRRKSPEN